MFRILVIHNAVVREILNHNQLTVRADSRALAFENVMVSGIVPVAVNHLAPLGRGLPVGKLSRVELKLGHRPAGAEAQTENSCSIGFLNKGIYRTSLKTESRRLERGANEVSRIVHSVVVGF